MNCFKEKENPPLMIEGQGSWSDEVTFLLWRRGEWTSCLHEWTFDDR